MFASLLYLSLVRLGQFLLLRLRTDTSKNVDIIVLRHQLAVLRRQTGPTRPSPAVRALLAVLSRPLPRIRWPAFIVTPATPLRWHRNMVRQTGSSPQTAYTAAATRVSDLS
ncbi:hypothetical protein [Acrocarpospora sp. B8E8]|uniref:hypothetical protein n=1 Tax=Acrocarpospora sp. B8E8 TaxID=3153572 RepID=UPI00325D7B5E